MARGLFLCFSLAVVGMVGCSSDEAALLSPADEARRTAAHEFTSKQEDLIQSIGAPPRIQSSRRGPVRPGN